MKIQGCKPDSLIIKNPVLFKEKAEFSGVMAGAEKALVPADEAGTAEQASRITRGVSVNMSFRATGGDNTAGYKNLIADSTRLEADLLRNIGDVCDDDTGNTIDMSTLDELLGIYIESVKE